MASSADAVMSIVMFLWMHHLSSYFGESITPAGRFDTKGEITGPEFMGKTKADGTIYRQPATHLRGLGTATRDAVMVGDDPFLGGRNAKEMGFVAVQFTGTVNRGCPP